MDLEMANTICKQALPFSVHAKLTESEIVGSANCIMLWSSGAIDQYLRRMCNGDEWQETTEDKVAADAKDEA